MNLDRRKFLVGLFGTVAVAAAGPLPQVLEQLPEKDFIKHAMAALPRHDEVYGNDLGQYGFAKIEWLAEPPYFKVEVPEDFRPLRAESDRINAEVMAKLRGNI